MYSSRFGVSVTREKNESVRVCVCHVSFGYKKKREQCVCHKEKEGKREKGERVVR